MEWLGGNLKIAFYIGSADISGGTYVIFQHAEYLFRTGHDVSIITQEKFSPEQLAWHTATQVLSILHFSELSGNESWDVIIATWWKTALEIHKFRAQRYFYFVQSIESRFYSEEEVPLRKLVDSTYELPLVFITEATWIKKYLDDKYRKNAFLVRNGIRKDLYCVTGVPIAPKPHSGIRVLVEGPLGVSFKNVENTLKLVKIVNPGEIWLLTSSKVQEVPGVDRVFSRVPITEVASIYRSCDVIVKLSYVEGMFGPPLEMFHCGGTAIVYDVTGHDEYIVDGGNGIVVRRDDESGVINALHSLLSNPGYLSDLKKNAIETANHWPDWELSSNQFAKVIEQFLLFPAVDISAVEEKNNNSWELYVETEQRRLRSIRAVGVNSKLKKLVSYFPQPVVLILKKVRMYIRNIDF